MNLSNIYYIVIKLVLLNEENVVITRGIHMTWTTYHTERKVYRHDTWTIRGSMWPCLPLETFRYTLFNRDLCQVRVRNDRFLFHTTPLFIYWPQFKRPSSKTKLVTSLDSTYCYFKSRFSQFTVQSDAELLYTKDHNFARHMIGFYNKRKQTNSKALILWIQI